MSNELDFIITTVEPRGYRWTLVGPDRTLLDSGVAETQEEAIAMGERAKNGYRPGASESPAPALPPNDGQVAKVRRERRK